VGTDKISGGNQSANSFVPPIAFLPFPRVVQDHVNNAKNMAKNKEIHQGSSLPDLERRERRDNIIIHHCNHLDPDVLLRAPLADR
jgi:hypothetical protein